LAPRITKLVVEVNANDPKLTVKRDMLPIEPDQWGRGIAVDSGKYVISAKAPGKQSWSETIEIKPGQPVVTVVVPELKPEPPVEAAAAVAPVSAAKKPPTPVLAPPAASADRSSTSYKAVGLAALGVGALTLGTSMGFRYKSANDNAKKICPTGHGCSEGEILEHQRLLDRASLNRTISYIGIGGGVACLAGAAIVYALDRPKKTSSAKLHALPALGESGFYGGVVSGAF